MGFCLFRQAESGAYFAVNSAQVFDMTAQGDDSCLLQFSFIPKDFDPLVSGSLDEVQKLLLEGSKIGVNKAEVTGLSGRDTLKEAPVIMHNVLRIVMVRELKPEEFKVGRNLPFLTASRVYLEDGSEKLIVQRPGVLAAMVNAGGRVPRLD